ncbi:MAG: thioredoxin family protein [Chloroflexi bacterium]|nr:thioredoxin family protein [Chloroflexota bacterium]
MSIRIKPVSAALLFLMLGLAVTSCNTTDVPEPKPRGLVVFAAASDVGLGTARVPLIVQRLDGTLFDDAAGRLEVTYSLPGAPDSSESGKARVVNDLTWREWPISGGVYTATMTFDAVGFWQVSVRATDDDQLLPGRAGVLVKSGTEAPDIGDPAPLSSTKTTPANGNLRSITSAPEPDPGLYAISFDDAVATGLPTVITFSTPAYCQSRTCGPQTEVLSQLNDTYAGRASFIHVEIFDNPGEMLAAGDPSLGIESPVIREWGLHTEPWTFVVDGSGIVVGRFEAFATADEIEETLVLALEGA